MKRMLVGTLIVPLLLLSGCGMAPKKGPEISADLLGDPYAHEWSDGDARTALWFTRNFPDDLAALGFATAQFFIYNKHDERYGVRRSHKTAQDRGGMYGVIFKSTPDDYFAMIQDPQLQVKMLSLEARNRNRLRERDRRRRMGEWPFLSSTSSEPDLSPSRMDDAEVEQRLREQYR